MAQKSKKLEEILSISGEVAKVISYADYFARKPLFVSLRAQNDGEETVEGLTLTLENGNGMLLPCEKELEIPFESAVEVNLGNILSPLYFSGLEGVTEETVTATLKKDKKVILTQTWTVTALPFEYWQGLDGDAELLASFVRPKLGDCARIQTEIAEQLKKWNTACELGGYVGNDKNTVRRVIAALYASLRRLAITKKPCNLANPVDVGGSTKIISNRKASSLELALFACGCLESVGLHPLLVFGEKEVACGVWLYDSCFLDTVSDDMQRLGAYAEEGINNVSCFDVEDIFSDKNAAYSTSETHFRQKLQEGVYERYTDVRRCRISHVMPLPLRVKSVKGFEMLSEEDMSPETAPKELRETQRLSLDAEETKDKQWERRLLDLSLKNTLLNFSPAKLAIRVLSLSADKVLDAFAEQDELSFSPATDDVLSLSASAPKFGVGAEVRRMRELIELENQAGILRTYMDANTLAEMGGRLFRKNTTES
ncbi:MAG: DUF4011 domain-containing protein [Clostridia bacterium]|nr:DUF4011 domain-containing protein [Clostridia bacterium]